MEKIHLKPSIITRIPLESKNDQNNQKKPKTMIKKCPITLENDQNTFETLENY